MGLRLKAAAIAMALGFGVFGLLHSAPRQWPLHATAIIDKAPAKPIFTSEPVFPVREGMSVHVASIVSLADGSLLASWYGGSREGAKDVKIYLCRRDPLTSLWGEPWAVMDREIASRDLGLYIKKVGNAVLSQDATGRLWLFYVSISIGGWSGSTINAMHSDDNGITWSKSRRLHLAPFMNLTSIVKNKPLLMSDGSLLIPAYFEFTRKLSEAVLFNPVSFKTRKARITYSGRLIQPGIAEQGTSLIALSRNMKGGHAMLSQSTDSGRTWSPPLPTNLPNPNSGLDILTLSNGRLLAAANDLPKGRHQLSLLISADQGRTWQQAKTLEQGPENSEYSYPFLMRSPDGMIHIVYTFERKQIKHAAFNEAWLESKTKPESGGQ